MKVYRSETVPAVAYSRDVQGLYAGLNPYESGALYDYTEYGYHSLNTKLYSGEALTEHESVTVTLLDDILNRHAQKQSRLLYRGAKRLYRGPVQEGEIHTFPAFTSATSNPHKVLGFISVDHPIIFEITTSAGCGISLLREEYEFLLPRNQRFRVERVQHGIEWHAEYEGTGYSRAVHNATVIEMSEV